MAEKEQEPLIDPTGMGPAEPGEDSSLGEQVSAVAEVGGKKTALMVAAGLVMLYMLYGIFFGGENKEELAARKAAEEAAKHGEVDTTTLPVEQQSAEIPDAPMQIPEPPLPPPPELPPAPAAPAPAIPMPGAPGLTAPGLPGPPGGLGAPARPQTAGQTNLSEAEKARVRANMMLMTGSGQLKGGGMEESQGGIAPSATPGASGGGAAGGEEGENQPESSVNEVGDPQLMIAQGKVLSAVLETAINTDLPGALRAVVSRDVYAEQGKNVLIPRGSRLIGSYNTDVKRGQARVYIVWNRLIMPNGFDLSLGSPSTDLLGRSGIMGHVDNKYFELFSNSLLLSSLSVGFAAAVDAVTDSQGISQGETGSGDATTSGSVVDIATLDAVNDFSDQVQGVVRDLVQVTPTITVNQGTRMKIFVNRDMFFPEDLAFLLDPPPPPPPTPEELRKMKKKH